MKKIFGFSLVEIVVALIIFSVITAALAPIITKKMKSNAVSVGMSSSSSIKFSDDCSEFGDDCTMCTTKDCALCNKDCAEGEYNDVSSCTCKTCNSLYDGCLECTSRKCEKCQAGYGLQSGTCTKCQKGYYGDGMTACKPASVGNYVPNEGASSQKPCPVGKYQDEEGKSECKTCEAGSYQNSEGQSSCKICEIDYACSGGNNRVQCAPNMGANEGSSSCSPCPADCSNCQIPSTCITCNNGYYVYDGACYICASGYKCNGTTQTKCSSGQYSPQGSSSCYNCPSTCSACTSSTNCTACKSGYYKSGGKCLSCPSTCSTCTSSTKCTACKSGYTLSKGACTAPCRVDNCAICASGTMYKCAECKSGYNMTDDNDYCGICIKRDTDGTCSHAKVYSDGNDYSTVCCEIKIASTSLDKYCKQQGYTKGGTILRELVGVGKISCKASNISNLITNYYLVNCVNSSGVTYYRSIYNSEVFKYSWVTNYNCSRFQ